MEADESGNKMIYVITDGPVVRVSVYRGPQVAAEFKRIGWRMEQVRPERKPAEPALAGLVNAFERGELPAWAAAWGQPWPLPEEQAARGASAFPWLDATGGVTLPRLPRWLLWHLAPSARADVSVDEALREAAEFAVLCLVDVTDLGDLWQNATWGPLVEEFKELIRPILSLPTSATPSERLWNLRLPPFADAAASRVTWMPSFKSRTAYGKKLQARDFSEHLRALGKVMVPAWVRITDSLVALVMLELLEAIASGATLRRCGQVGCNRAFLAETRLHDFCYQHAPPASTEADALRIKSAYERHRQRRGEAALPFEEWHKTYKSRGRGGRK